MKNNYFKFYTQINKGYINSKREVFQIISEVSKSTEEILLHLSFIRNTCKNSCLWTIMEPCKSGLDKVILTGFPISGKLI